MTERFRLTQKMLLAGADILWKAQILDPAADPTRVMVAVAHLITAIERVRPANAREARDIDPTLMRKIISGQ